MYFTICSCNTIADAWLPFISQDHLPISIIIWKTFMLRCQRAEREHLCLLPKTSAWVSCAWPSTCCHCEQDSTYQVSNWTGNTDSPESCCPLVVVTGKYSNLTQCCEPKGILVWFKLFICHFSAFWNTVVFPPHVSCLRFMIERHVAILMSAIFYWC